MPISDTTTPAEFFLGSNSNVVLIETLSFDHSTFSPIYIVRNVQAGITIDGTDYVYYPAIIKDATSADDMDFVMSITFGDLGEVMPQLIDAIAAAGKFDEKPIVQYKAYRSDDETSLYGVITMEVMSVSHDENGCVIECAAPSINKAKVGEYYTIDRFPMLAAFT